MVRKRLYIVFGGVRGHTLPIVFPYSSTTSLPKNELDSYLAPVFLNHSPSVPKKKKLLLYKCVRKIPRINAKPQY